MKILTVSDLHQSTRLYGQLQAAVVKHQPDLVCVNGDFLDATGDDKGRLTVEECAVAMASLPCPEIVFTRGNHEDSALWLFQDLFQRKGREFTLLDGSAATFGPLVVVGFPCLLGSGDGAFETPELGRWLPRLMRDHGPAARSLWLMHEPPIGTCLSAQTGFMAGNPEWRDAIERFLPRLVIFGHDHGTPIRTGKWSTTIGSTLCVNVGQEEKGLRYAVIEAQFAATHPSLARSFRVTAYPSGKTVQWPRPTQPPDPS